MGFGLPKRRICRLVSVAFLTVSIIPQESARAIASSKVIKADPSCRKSRVMNLCEAVNEKQPPQVVGVTTL